MNSYDLLISHDIKPSVQRMAIMDYLASHKTHPSADEIYNAIAPIIPTLSKTTVYNTLKLFAKQGAVQLITIDERTEHFDADISIHAHFLCKTCGKIYDIFIPEKNIPSMRMLKNEGYLVDETHLYYKGICKNCRETK
jgi:Fe2+ or Zn2+ uptake regulation protein